MAKYETPTISLTYMVEADVLNASTQDPYGNDKNWTPEGDIL